MVRAIDDSETRVRRRWAREGFEREEYVAEYRPLPDIRRSVVTVIQLRDVELCAEVACLTTEGRFHLSREPSPDVLLPVLPVYELVNFDNSAISLFLISSLLSTFDSDFDSHSRRGIHEAGGNVAEVVP